MALILLIHNGQGRAGSHEDIAHEHGVNIRCVHRWVAAFTHGGIGKARIKKRPTGLNSLITNENKEIILSALFDDSISLVILENTRSLRSLARCLTDELDIPISFKRL